MQVVEKYDKSTGRALDHNPLHRGGNSSCQSQAYTVTLYQRPQGCHGCPAIQNLV